MVLSYLQAETAAGRQPYSIFDLLAGLGTGFLANMCMTVVVPVALSSAESRNHPSPLTGSGGASCAGTGLPSASTRTIDAVVLQTNVPFLRVRPGCQMGTNLAALGESTREECAKACVEHGAACVGFEFGNDYGGAQRLAVGGPACAIAVVYLGSFRRQGRRFLERHMDQQPSADAGGGSAGYRGRGVAGDWRSSAAGG